MKRLIYISLLFSLSIFSQNSDGFYDLTNEIDAALGGWSIGNGCDDVFYFKAIHVGDLDMNNEPLEIMNSHFIIQGNIINQGELIYSCNFSILEIKGHVLAVEIPEKETFKIYPNPAISEINIKGIEVSKLELYDIFGSVGGYLYSEN